MKSIKTMFQRSVDRYSGQPLQRPPVAKEDRRPSPQPFLPKAASMDDLEGFLAGPAGASFASGGWESPPEEVPELGAEEAEDLNARLLGTADRGPPDHEDIGPPVYDDEMGFDEIDPSWWSEQQQAVPEASAASASAGPMPDAGRVGRVAGKGIPGKGKWNNLPTVQPNRGADGGARGHKRSGGQYASWYRQFYALKKTVAPEVLQRWLDAHPKPGEGGKGGGKGPGKGGGKGPGKGGKKGKMKPAVGEA